MRRNTLRAFGPLPVVTQILCIGPAFWPALAFLFFAFSVAIRSLLNPCKCGVQATTEAEADAFFLPHFDSSCLMKKENLQNGIWGENI